MDTEAERALRGMVRAGTVSSVNPANSTARVEFDDKDGTVSPELHILHRGSGANKDYWLPDVGEQVVCLFANNDKNFSTGWILGTYFTEKKPPQVNNQDIRRLDFSDGTFIEYNRGTHALTIHVKGEIKVNGSTIYLN